VNQSSKSKRDPSKNYNEISEETIVIDDLHHRQGTQGDQQMKFDNIDLQIAQDFRRTFDPNSTQTRNLLSIEQSRLEIYLQRLYQSKRCQYFYILLLLSSVTLVIVTLAKGFEI